jgi:hypothetical protein
MGVNPKTCGLVVMAVGITIGFCLFIGGSVAGKNYSALSALIPALLALGAHYGLQSTSDPMAQHGWINYDGWAFLLAFFLISTFGLPVVIAHCLAFPGTSIGLYISGSAVILISFIIGGILGKDPQDGAW